MLRVRGGHGRHGERIPQTPTDVTTAPVPAIARMIPIAVKRDLSLDQDAGGGL